MRPEGTEVSKPLVIFYTLAIVVALCLMGWLTRRAVFHTFEASVDTQKFEERWKAIGELRVANDQLLNNYGWQEQAKGLVRLKIERAMELTVQEWKNPQEARAKLISRLDKAAAPAPKPVYE